MPYKTIIRDYAVSLCWPTGHHYFETEMFDDLADARARERQLTARYEMLVKTQVTKPKSVPRIFVWARQPNYKALTVSRAPRRVSSKSRNQGALP